MKPPLFSCLKQYTRKDLLRDMMAGLMVAIIALPLSIALGIQSVPIEVSSRGIQYGIITAIIAGFFISAIGGSHHQIGGPTAAFIVILYGYLADPKIGILGLAVAGILAGMILILLGLLRAGSVMRFFPYPITVGFTTGIGITLLIGQIKDLCGFDATGTEAIEKVVSYVKNIGSFDLPTFLIGLLGLACVIGLPRISKKIPSAFAALILCTATSLLLNNLAGTKIATIGSCYGQVTAGFFPIDLGGVSSLDFSALIVPALVIAFLCAIESLLSATVATGMTGVPFDANQELIGQGGANILSSLFGGLPATGAIARTAAAIENGARTPLAGMFHSVFILIMYFLLMNVVQYIPLAVFSAILISVAINMSRFRLFAKLLRFGFRDVAILVATCALTVLFDLTYGVLGGIALTFLLNIKSIRTGIKIERTEESDSSVTLAVNGALFFLNANKLTSAITEEFSRTDRVTIDMSDLQSIDETAIEKLSSVKKLAKTESTVLGFSQCSEKNQGRIEKYIDVV